MIFGDGPPVRRRPRWLVPAIIAAVVVVVGAVAAVLALGSRTSVGGGSAAEPLTGDDLAAGRLRVTARAESAGDDGMVIKVRYVNETGEARSLDARLVTAFAPTGAPVTCAAESGRREEAPAGQEREMEGACRADEALSGRWYVLYDGVEAATVDTP